MGRPIGGGGHAQRKSSIGRAERVRSVQERIDELAREHHGAPAARPVQPHEPPAVPPRPAQADVRPADVELLRRDFRKYAAMTPEQVEEELRSGRADKDLLDRLKTMSWEAVQRRRLERFKEGRS